MRKENFQIGMIAFEWGLTLTDIKTQLLSDAVFLENENPYAKHLTLKIPFSEIWSVNTNSVVFNAPSSDRLINTISINIASTENDPEYLIHKLEKRFGPKSTNRLSDNYGSGSVIRNCTWDYENCVIGVSIYGGIRKENKEENSGCLYVNMRDIILLDALYTARLRAIETNLKGKVKHETIKIFRMEQRQRISWSLTNDEYPGQSPNFIARALNGYYNRNIYKTPRSLREALNEYEVSVWEATTHEYYLSNYWETIELTPTLKISWVNALPAKGGGYCAINIGHLDIDNDHSKAETSTLMAHLEEILGVEINCHQDYDC